MVQSEHLTSVIILVNILCCWCLISIGVTSALSRLSVLMSRQIIHCPPKKGHLSNRTLKIYCKGSLVGCWCSCSYSHFYYDFSTKIIWSTALPLKQIFVHFTPENVCYKTYYDICMKIDLPFSQKYFSAFPQNAKCQVLTWKSTPRWSHSASVWQSMP